MSGDELKPVAVQALVDLWGAWQQLKLRLLVSEEATKAVILARGDMRDREQVKTQEGRRRKKASIPDATMVRPLALKNKRCRMRTVKLLNSLQDP